MSIKIYLGVLNMINRISKYEEKLDSVINSIKLLDEAINVYKNNIKNIKELNKYYGSKNWFKDKEDYENNKIPKIKVGVLGEDTIWNMNEDINDLIKEMKSIVKNYKG